MAPKPGTNFTVDIEPFDPARHDRTVFFVWIGPHRQLSETHAKKHQKDDFARVFVAVAPGETSILGYYAINAHGVEAQDLPATLSRKAPRHGYVPAAYLSIIGVDQRVQGQGLGQVLLVDALKRVLPLSEEIGLAVVILDVIEDGGAEEIARRTRFYERLGFQSMPSRPTRMYFSMKNIRAALED